MGFFSRGSQNVESFRFAMPILENTVPEGRSPEPPFEDLYDDGYLRIEHRNYYVACANEVIQLPRTEFLLLSRLVRSIDRVVSSEELWRYVWGNEKPLNSESLHVYIYRLRNKLIQYNVRIDTLVNVGYRLESPTRR
jgi:DNA-binding response OmpR family regulator